MRRTPWLAALRIAPLFALIFLLAVPAVESAETVIIEMRTVNSHPVFLPAEVTVEPGDTVRWVNLDQNLEHSTCSGSGLADPGHGELWRSELLQFGEYFEYTFVAPGDYAYFSIPHEYEGMLGLVRVESGTNAPGGGVEISTWGKIKNGFAELLPRE